MNRRQFIAAAALSTAGATLAAAQDKAKEETTANLATPCGVYCGSCRFYMNETCKGCASKKCGVRKCCVDKCGLDFCTQCDHFPCPKIKGCGRLDGDWLDKQGGEETP
jgi:hypothetical protein